MRIKIANYAAKGSQKLKAFNINMAPAKRQMYMQAYDAYVFKNCTVRNYKTKFEKPNAQRFP